MHSVINISAETNTHSITFVGGSHFAMYCLSSVISSGDAGKENSVKSGVVKEQQKM